MSHPLAPGASMFIYTVFPNQGLERIFIITLPFARPSYVMTVRFVMSGDLFYKLGLDIRWE